MIESPLFRQIREWVQEEIARRLRQAGIYGNTIDASNIGGIFDGTLVETNKVKVSINDSTPGYLNGKLVAGTNISLAEGSDGGDETLTIASTAADEKVKVTSNDTTGDYLFNKLAAGSAIAITETNDGGDEDATIAVDLTGLTEELTVDGVNDEALFYDNSAAAHRKIPPWRFQSSSRMIYAATADKEVVDTVSETSLFGNGAGTLTIPANSLVAGSVIYLYARGQMGDTGTPTLNLIVSLGGTTICSTTATTLTGITAVEWQIEVTITMRAVGASGSAVGGGLFDYDDGTEIALSSGSAVAVDTTGDLVIDFTATWGTASASNTILAREAIVEIKNPPPGTYSAGASGDALLLETGDFILLESGDFTLLE